MVYLWWVYKVESLVETEVDEPQKGSVELCEGGHYPIVHISRVLEEQRLCLTL